MKQPCAFLDKTSPISDIKRPKQESTSFIWKRRIFQNRSVLPTKDHPYLKFHSVWRAMHIYSYEVQTKIKLKILIINHSEKNIWWFFGWNFEFLSNIVVSNFDFQSTEIENQLKSTIIWDRQSSEIDNQLRSTINPDWQATKIDK